MFFVLEGRVEVLVPLAQPGPKMLKREAFMDKVEAFLSQSQGLVFIGCRFISHH